MMRRFAVLVILLPVLFAGTERAIAKGTHPDDVAPYRDGIVLMSFNKGIQPSQQKAILATVGAREVKHIGVNVHVLAVKPGHVLSAIHSLIALHEVQYAEPDYLQTLSAGTLPNDTNVGIQWAVQNTGQNVNGVSGTAGADERSLAAWSVTTGTNSVVIAELDTGIQYSHPDLFTNMWNNPGGIGGCPAGTHGYNVLASSCDPMDDDSAYMGHGTHVAGIMGAVGNNAAGTAGVNWTTSIMAVKCVNSGGTGATSDLITAMDWVVKAKQAGVNVRVANDSQTWPGTASSQSLSNEIDLLGSNDILFVVASGNTSQNNDSVPRYPCSYARPTMICAAASDQNDKLWSQANYGTSSVQLAAPGVNIYSTLRNSNYGYISGGSMAAPQVSGAAALILSLGYQSVSSLRTSILNNADRLSSLSGLVGTAARLNVCAAISGCSSGTTAKPANTTAPFVTSLPVQGGLLGAGTGVWSGLPNKYTYQWSRCSQSGTNCTAIQGATGQTYALLAPADNLATLAVTITASNSSGSTSVTSSPSSAVASANSASSITSSIVSGANISGSVNWTVTPSRPEQFVLFYIDGVLIQKDVTSPYVFNATTTSLLDTTTLPNGTHTLGVRALYTDNRTYDFYGESVTVANPPINTALPTLSGTVIPGQTISTTNGTWSSNATPTGYTYQWEHCDSNGLNCAFISGAASSTYLLSAADTNFTMRSVINASNLGGSVQVVSAQTGVVPPPPLVITTSSLPSAMQNSPYSQSVVATGGIPPYTWSISSGTLPVGLSISSSTGAISGTPTGSGNSNFTVAVTDTRQVVTTQGLSINVGTPPTITTTSLPAGTQLSSYSASVSATGGAPPYTWSILSGSLPNGLSLSSSRGAITGLSTVTGTSNFTVQVSDSNSLTAVKPLSIAMNGLITGGGSIGLVQANSVQGSGVGSVSTAFPISNTAGNLIVAFVRMSSSTQTVSLSDTAGNTYTQAVTQLQNTDGHQIYLFYAKNILSAAGNTVTATFSSTNNHPWLAIYEFQGLSITNPLDQTASSQGNSTAPSVGPTATTTSPTELIIAGTGLASSYSGSEVAGNGYVLLENDPANSPGFNEFALVTSTGTYSATFSLAASPYWSAVMATFISGAPTAPVVTTASLPNAVQSSNYSTVLAATGGTPPFTWSISSGSLPAGLSITPGTGAISGSATASGTSNFTVQVMDANSLTGTKSLSLTVIAPPAITTTSLPSGTVNAAYSTTLAATSGTPPYTWSVSSGSLPSGLSLASATGTISGTPTAAGTSNFTVQVTDANLLTATQPLSLVVNPAPLAITTTSPLPSGTLNSAYSTTLAATGGTTPYSWSILSGTLPAGLSIAPGTGMISGTPTATGTSNFTVQVTDANSVTATQALSLTVGTAPPTVTTPSLPNGTQNIAYSTTLAATGGTAPYTWSLSSGTLPAGLSLTAGTGMISGTPTGTGVSNFTVQVTDASSLTGTKSLSLTIIAQPTVTTSSLPNGSVNTAYSTTLAASGGTTPYTWSLSSGTLPAGLSLTAGTGAISGTPTTAGTSNFTVQVTDVNSLTATKALSITITAASGGGIGLVQQNAAQGSGVGSVSVSFPATNTAGNLILAFVRMSSTSQTVNLTDSAGNPYIQAVTQAQNSDGSQIYLFYAKNVLGAANTVTATFSATNNHPWLAIYEYKGLNAASPLDVTASASGNSTTPSSGATASTSSANELVFSGLGLPASFSGTQTVGSGFTLLQKNSGGSNGGNESMLTTTTGSYTGTFTLSSGVNWSALIATFKP